MNAVELLKQDHETVKQLFERLSKTTERGVKTREELMRHLHEELTAHTRVEEEIFYPAFRSASGKEGEIMFQEAQEEHRAVKVLILPDIEKTDPSSIEFAGRMKVLKELVEHHIEEEEQEMLPKASELLGEDRLEELGAQMESRKKALKRQLAGERAV
ncbi:hemerythrin domain-containing protein [Azotobacter beijerinckii]|uniref:Hemerythrin HHE cation binding domain-containing protein n=1 Tax=Azotobacter beijerinckii TaxID=170623 RepID=A0A1I4HYZ0_9GAMM|nr:hemerythrin domain-containing protein [Azotobacter beijerinckii]SFL46716.1 Hemerythrin HHE cation binding domain-containing protein [Azotobacter beijerinckii]